MKNREKVWFGVVYVITNIVNSKQYVGQAVGDLLRRWNRHKATALSGDPRPLYCAIRKYGASKFTIIVCQRCKTIETLNLAETRWIKRLRTLVPEGYNLTLGGDGTVGHKHTEASKKVMAAAAIAWRKNAPSEWIAAYSETQSKVQRERWAKVTPEWLEATRAAISAGLQQPSVKAKRSQSMKAVYDKPGAREAASVRTKKRFSGAGRLLHKAVFAKEEVRARCSVGAFSRFSDPVKLAEYLVARHSKQYGPRVMSFKQVVKLAKARIAAKK